MTIEAILLSIGVGFLSALFAGVIVIAIGIINARQSP